jgi:hypothetical protein
MARTPTRDLRTSQAFNAFYFTHALGGWPHLARFFATHPPLEPARPAGQDLHGAGAAFDDVRQEVRALLEAADAGAGAGAGAAGVEAVRDEYGYSWLVSRRQATGAAGPGG